MHSFDLLYDYIYTFHDLVSFIITNYVLLMHHKLCVLRWAMLQMPLEARHPT